MVAMYCAGVATMAVRELCVIKASCFLVVSALHCLSHLCTVTSVLHGQVQLFKFCLMLVLCSCDHDLFFYLIPTHPSPYPHPVCACANVCVCFD